MRRFVHHIGAVLVLTGAAHAAERVVLTTGYELRADRHEVSGEVVRVFNGAGVSELPKSLVSEYRVEEYVAPAAVVAAVVPAPQPIAQPVKVLSVREMVDAAAKKHGLPPALVAALVKAESAFRVDALSKKGAIGLMQLMPGTASVLGADPHDPAQNVDAGTRYLRDLLARYESDPNQVVKALAAYNAGPGAVDKYQGVPPYSETRAYVRRIVKGYLAELGQ